MLFSSTRRLKNFQFSRSSSTVIGEELSKFSKISFDWWNPEGDLKTLHQINPVRVR
jgi:2-polyprenyl-3-methyl-5-hydroxy-6-metoxy-1,4-benzoquinol methylase